MEIYRKRVDNKLAITNQVLKVFTDQCGGDHKELAELLYVQYQVECFEYSDDWKYFNVMGYFKEVVVPHKVAVYQAGLEMCRNKDIVSGIDKQELLYNLWVHDLSKFSSNESLGYCFYNRENGSGKAEFKKSWHHHKHNNPHHPEYWYSVDKVGVSTIMDMPKIFAIEMVADWIGAGVVYGNDIKEWLPKNIGNFRFSEKTAIELSEILSYIGFDARPSGESVFIP